MPNPSIAHPSIADFESRIADPSFPCVGAKSAAA